MKLSRRQLRKIIKEEKQKFVFEANSDGTISADEEELEEELANYVILELETLIQQVQEESTRIGGAFRGPGIRARIFEEMRNTIKRRN